MNYKTKATLLALLRATVAMIIFAVAVINYEKLKNIDVRAIVEASSNVYIAVATIWGVYLVKSVLFISTVFFPFSPAFCCFQKRPFQKRKSSAFTNLSPPQKTTLLLHLPCIRPFPHK